MLTSSRTTPSASLPIPIQSNKVRNRYTSKKSLVGSCTPPKSNSMNSFDFYYNDSVSSSSFQSSANKYPYVEDLDEDYCVVSCKDITSYLTYSRVHLVNGLNVDNTVKDYEEYYVLCDCPKIKTPSNYLSYSLLETKKGVLAFTSKEHISVLKDQLDISYHVVEMTKNELMAYTFALKSNAIVLYNSYTDMDVKTSYFLYYLLEA